jgi:hypothetical protein
MNNCLGLLVGIAAVVGVPLQSQTEPTPSLSYGAATVALGMAKDTVLARLAEEYAVKPSSTKGAYFVASRKGPPYSISAPSRSTPVIGWCMPLERGGRRISKPALPRRNLYTARSRK